MSVLVMLMMTGDDWRDSDGYNTMIAECTRSQHTPTLASKYCIKDVKALYRFCIVTEYKVNSNKFNGIARLGLRVEDIVETLNRNYVENFKQTDWLHCLVWLSLALRYRRLVSLL